MFSQGPHPWPLGEKVGQAWRLHVHPQDVTKAAYVNRKGEVTWSESP